MYTVMPNGSFWRLAGAGTLLTALSLVGLTSAVRGDDLNMSGRRASSRAGAPYRQYGSPSGDYDILQTLEEEMAPPAEGPPTPSEHPAYESAGEKEAAPEEPAAAAPPEVWNLTNLFTDCEGHNTFKDNGVKISGHMQWGIVSNPDGAFVGNGPTLNEAQWDFFGLQQAYLYGEKVADGSKGLGWGWRVDGLYGLQGFDGQSFGNINVGHWDFLNGFDHNPYNFAVPQAYGELAYNKWSIKLGHFYTIVGYEVVPSTAQFFITRQLTFWNSEPFTHTGALNTYKVNDKFTVLAGWVAGMDTGFYQFNGGSSFLGGFTWTIDTKTTLAYSMIGGNLGWRGDGAINSAILSRQWTPKFATVHQFDVLASNLTQMNANTFPGTNIQTGTFSFGNIPQNFNMPGGVPRQSQGFINYAFYDLTPKIKLGFRGEWFNADNQDYYTFTYGLNWKPHPNLLIRPELRHMVSPDNHQIYSGNGFTGQLYNQVLYAADFIVIF
jgi:hypothetical protein